MRKSVTLLLILVFLIALSIATPLTVKAEPEIIIVPDDYPTIQEALDNANAGDTAFVKKGTYYAPHDQVIVIDKPLSLIGEDRENTIIDGINKGEYVIGHYVFRWDAITIRASNVTITGFTIKNCNNAIIIDVQGSGTKIIGNNILNNRQPIGVGSGSNFLISGNNIADNDVGVSIGTSNGVISGNNITGLGVWGCQNVTIKENNISGNGVYVGGLSLGYGGPYYVYENNITDNLEFGIRFERGCNNSAIFNNNIRGNEIGVLLDNFAFASFSQIGSGNKVYSNNLMENTQNAFVKHTYPYNISMMDNIIGNGTDIVLWDNGKIGNYWSDYQSKYPNATEVNASGVGNIPYLIDENNIDHYPLLLPVDISAESTPLLPEPEPFPTVLVAIAIIGLVAGVAAGLLFYFKKRKH